MKTIEEKLQWYLDLPIDKERQQGFSLGFRKCAEFMQRWIPVEEVEELPDGLPVIGFNKEWIDDDVNPLGTRECFTSDMGEFGWVCARWSASLDEYITDFKCKPTHWRPINFK